MVILKENIRVVSNLATDIENMAQNLFIRMAVEETNELLEQYCDLESSYDGRYICSDLFKELFPLYAQDKESRNLFIRAVHNSSACLANEHFQNVAKDDSVTDCIFLTGIPGAGKSFLIQSLFLSGMIPDSCAVYEGDINNIDVIKEKIEAMKNNGKNIHFMVVNASLELIYSNICTRRNEVGRAASMATIARIASKLPHSLKTLKDLYPDIDVSVYDKKTNTDDINIYDNVIDFEFLDKGGYDDIISSLEQLAQGLTLSETRS